MKDLIENKFKQFGINLTEKQLENFETYFKFLIEENEKFNLTAITSEQEVIEKHFIDSILPINEIPQNAYVIDVGTGAGFPGVPIKILRDDIKLVLLDSLQKRVNFLQNLTKLLNLKNVECVHDRAENFAKQKREVFDVAMSRAVAQMPTLSEYLFPFVKSGGKIIMYKGQKGEYELKESGNAINILGGKYLKNLKFNFNYGERNIFIFDKVRLTPKKYPRDKNQPKTKPLK